MKTLIEQFAYEDYSKQHYTSLSKTSQNERNLQRISTGQSSATQEPRILLLLRSRLAYVVAIMIVALLTVTRMVVAAIAGGGGGGGYFVR
jgi:hypothetical protein